MQQCTTNKYLLQKHIYARIYPLTNNLFIIILASLHSFSQKNKTADALWVLRVSPRIFVTGSFFLAFFSFGSYLFFYFFPTTFYFSSSHLVRIRGCTIARIFCTLGARFCKCQMIGKWIWKLLEWCFLKKKLLKVMYCEIILKLQGYPVFLS